MEMFLIVRKLTWTRLKVAGLKVRCRYHHITAAHNILYILGMCKFHCYLPIDDNLKNICKVLLIMLLTAEHPTIVEDFFPKVKIAEEQDVTILCSATGAPKPVITWKKDNVSLVIDGTTSRISSETGSLVIKVS